MEYASDFAIETQGLTKKFGQVQALNDVDLKVPRHSIFGFLGPNGAGKTTTMKILLGLAEPTSGVGEIFGHDIVAESLAIRERIGYLPQYPRFIEYMTARENLIFSANFYFRGPQAKIHERCDEMLELVGLTGKADRPIKGFSGGEKQRLGIALGAVLGGNLLASFIKPLLYVTPWMLPKVASLVAGGQPVSDGMLWPPLITSVVWSVLFIIIALMKFKRTEF